MSNSIIKISTEPSEILPTPTKTSKHQVSITKNKILPQCPIKVSKPNVKYLIELSQPVPQRATKLNKRLCFNPFQKVVHVPKNIWPLSSIPVQQKAVLEETLIDTNINSQEPPLPKLACKTPPSVPVKKDSLMNCDHKCGSAYISSNSVNKVIKESVNDDPFIVPRHQYLHHFVKTWSQLHTLYVTSYVWICSIFYLASRYPAFGSTVDLPFMKVFFNTPEQCVWSVIPSLVRCISTRNLLFGRLNLKHFVKTKSQLYSFWIISLNSLMQHFFTRYGLDFLLTKLPEDDLIDGFVYTVFSHRYQSFFKRLFSCITSCYRWMDSSELGLFSIKFGPPKFFNSAPTNLFC